MRLLNYAKKRIASIANFQVVAFVALLPTLILGVSLQWDKVSFKNTVAPSTRSHHTSIFTENSVMVTFGGYDGAQYKNDV